MALDIKKLSFNQEEGRDFHSELRKKIALFFKEKGKSPKANFLMYAKSFFLLGLPTLLYVLMLSEILGHFSPLFYPVLGFLISIGIMNITHDALHGAYLSGRGNRLLGYLMDIIGASSFYWKKEHTIAHHTYTNISGYDADLDVPFVLRLCPKAPRYKFHRFQHIYAPILYSLNLIHWIYVSDIKRLFNIIRYAGTSKQIVPLKEIFPIFLFKAIHILLFIVLPMIFLSASLWQILLGYFSFLAVGGITITVIFQLAHIVENVAFPSPDEEGRLEYNFFEHQLSTTSNFATKSRLVSFLFGGLNFQIEHHIFPHICHIHLRHISPIVKATAQEFGLPYHENRSFFGAIASHFRTLKKLGDS